MQAALPSGVYTSYIMCAYLGTSGQLGCVGLGTPAGQSRRAPSSHCPHAPQGDCSSSSSSSSGGGTAWHVGIAYAVIAQLDLLLSTLAECIQEHMMGMLAQHIGTACHSRSVRQHTTADKTQNMKEDTPCMPDNHSCLCAYRHKPSTSNARGLSCGPTNARRRGQSLPQC
jgi:hypothetical protein